MEGSHASTLTQAHAHTLYITDMDTVHALVLEGNLGHTRVPLTGPMRRACMYVSLMGAVKDIHKVAAFIRKAGQWVWGEFRHRAAGFDAQQSVITLLKQQHTCGTRL